MVVTHVQISKAAQQRALCTHAMAPDMVAPVMQQINFPQDVSKPRHGIHMQNLVPSSAQLEYSGQLNIDYVCIITPRYLLHAHLLSAQKCAVQSIGLSPI